MSDTQNKIQELQLLEQNMQNILMQKQQVQQQMTEIDSALNELESAGKAYKIIGNIMISSEPSKLKEEMTQKKETAQIRLKSITKQEDKLREKSQALQSEVMDSMDKEQ
jgi:prefoldin beta subunit